MMEDKVLYINFKDLTFDKNRIIHKEIIHGGTKYFIVFYQDGKIFFSICTREDNCFTVESWAPSDDVIGLQNMYYVAFDEYLEKLKD